MSFVIIALNAILIQNFVLVRFFGCCPFLGVSKKTDTAVGMGLAVIFTMTMSSAITYVLYHFILVPLDAEYLKTIVFILVIASLVQLIEMFLEKMIPSLYSSLGIYLPLITTNCAVLSVTLLNVSYEYGFFKSVFFGCMSGVGFLLATVLLALIRERLEHSDIPKSFKGLPIALIAAAILSMAFMGFQGLKLPF